MLLLKVHCSKNNLKQHIVTIGVYQLLSNSAIYEHRCLENIKKLYKYYGKCDDKKQYKAIIEAEMVSNNEAFTDNNPMSPSQYMTVKSPVHEKHSIIFQKN